MIFICSNTETLTRGELPSGGGSEERAASAYVCAAARALDDAGLDYELDSSFANRNGGRRRQFGESFGAISVVMAKATPKRVSAACEAADSAGFSAMAEEIEQIKLEELSYADECEAEGDAETAESIRAAWAGEL